MSTNDNYSNSLEYKKIPVRSSAMVGTQNIWREIFVKEKKLYSIVMDISSNWNVVFIGQKSK
jgi:hypothetical protein